MRIATLHVFLGVALLTIPIMVSAQSLTPPAPYHLNIKTMNAVNAASGKISIEVEDISVGSRDNRSDITLRRTIAAGSAEGIWSMFGAGMSSNLHNYLKGGGALYLNGFGSTPATYNSSIIVVVDGKSFLFGRSGNEGSYTFTDVYGMGAQLIVVDEGASIKTYRLTERDGTVATFIVSTAYRADSHNPFSATWVATIDRPTGDRWTFSYEPARIESGVTLSNRLKSVSNSQGYGLKFFYVNPALGGALDSNKLLVSRVDAVSASCDIYNASCETSALYSVGYSYKNFSGGAVWCDSYEVNTTCTSARLMTAFTDAGGVQHRYDQFDEAHSLPLKFYTGANVNPDIKIALSSYWINIDQEGREISAVAGNIVDANSNQASFSYDKDYGGANTMTVTTPTGANWVYHTNYQAWYSAPVVNDPIPDWIKDPNGGITYYTYDNKARLISIKDPEGITTSTMLDDRGNVLERRAIPKPGSGLGEIVSTQTFPACTTSNFRICNQPSYVIDARGNRTDYTYDPASGGILTEAGPADASGNRPLTTYGYTAYTGYDGATFYRQTSKTVSIDASHNLVTTSTFDASNHWALKETINSDGSTGYRECSFYDQRGNLASKTSANAGLTICP